MNNAVCSANITTIEHHHHQHYASGTGHKSAFIPIIITWQQDPAARLPNFTQHYITTLASEKMNLEQKDQAMRLSNTLCKPPLCIAVGKP
jgi:hypothetical protein